MFVIMKRLFLDDWRIPKDRATYMWQRRVNCTIFHEDCDIVSDEIKNFQLCKIYNVYMRAFLIIDTEDLRKKIEVTHTQVNSLIPIITKINKKHSDYQSHDSLELFMKILNTEPVIFIDDITSINIVYHN